MPIPDNALAQGLRLDGRYQVRRVIGSGGFGVTYECCDTQTGAQVAIKELCPPDAQRDGTVIIPQHNIEFFEEAKAQCREHAKLLSTLRHSGIVRVVGYFEENNTVYLVMGFLQGDTLQHLLEREGPQTKERVLGWAKQLGVALEAVHGLGLLHLDIKPDNIFLTHDNRLVLMDFDLAQRIHAPRDYRTRPLSLTAHCGTPGYAAPEQYSGQGHYSPATDIYGLAATLFHALSGEEPLPATDRAASGETSIWSQQASTQLHSAISWALQLPMARRPQTVRAFLQSLEEPPVPVSTHKRRSRPGTRVLTVNTLPNTNAPSQVATPQVITTPPTLTAVPPVMTRSEVWHEARFLRRDIVWPPFCACCMAPEETSVVLRAGKSVWNLPYCIVCAKHVRTAREALPQALWPIIGGFFIAMLGLWQWGLFLGPLGFVVHFSGISFWALKNGLSDDLTTACCHETKLAAIVENHSSQGSHWKFKNPQFLEEVRAVNVGYVI